jgi:hypothetical protein
MCLVTLIKFENTERCSNMKSVIKGAPRETVSILGDSMNVSHSEWSLT